MAYRKPNRKPKKPSKSDHGKLVKADLTARDYSTRFYEGMTDEEIEQRYYRLHTFLDKGPNRREQREFLESKYRLLPSGNEPIMRELMEKVFRP